MQNFSITATICGLWFVAISALAQEEDRFAKVEVTAQKVAGNVYMLQGSGGNIGVSIGDNGTLIIDDQFAPLAERILAAINKIDGSQPKYVLNTHFHGDHTGSNAFFGQQGTIVAHQNVRVRLLGQDVASTALPVLTFSDQLNLYFNNDELQLIHLPNGHTDGDSMVWFKKANVAHLGDQLFNGRFPYIDLPSGGTVEGYMRNLETVISTLPADVKIIPGHGELGEIASVVNSLRVIRATNKVVTDKLNSGESLDDTIAEGLPVEFAEWASGFINTENWIRILHGNWQRNQNQNGT